MTQGGEGLRAPSAVVEGGTIRVEVGPNESEVDVNVAGSSQVTHHPVEPGKVSDIPVPPVPAGTLLYLTVGRGVRTRVVVVEVVAPSSN